MTLRILALALLGFAILPTGHAQERKTTTEQPALKGKTDRAVYTVRGGDAATLAQVISTNFRGELVVSALPDALVLSGNQAAVNEALKLLDQIDRPTRSVEIEVTLVDVAKPEAGIVPTAADTLAKLDELAKAGATVQRIKLTAMEGQQVSTQSGTNKPYTSAVNRGGGGGNAGFPGQPTRSVSYQQIGTTIKATTRVGADGTVALELSVQDSGMKPSEVADEPPVFDTATLSTHLSIPKGQAVIAQAIRKDAKAARSVTLVIVTAKATEAK